MTERSRKSLSDRQLNELAQRLGEKAGASLDVERTAAAVVGRLRKEDSTEVTWRRHSPIYGALAAAAAVVLAVGILSYHGGNQDLNALDLARAPFELQALSFEELEEVYDSLSFDAPVYELTGASLEDLSVGQLEELLQTMMED